MTSAVPGAPLRAGTAVVLGADFTSIEQSGRTRLGDLLAVR